MHCSILGALFRKPPMLQNATIMLIARVSTRIAGSGRLTTGFFRRILYDFLDEIILIDAFSFSLYI